MLAQEAAAIPPGSEKLLFLPHLSGRNTPESIPTCAARSWGSHGAMASRTWVRARHGEHRLRYAFYLRAVREIAPNYDARHAINIAAGPAAPCSGDQGRCARHRLPLPGARGVRETLGSAIIAGHAVGLFPDIAETARKFAGKVVAKTSRDPRSPPPSPLCGRLYRCAGNAFAASFARMSRTLSLPEMTGWEGRQ